MKLTKTMREMVTSRLIERTRAPRDARLRSREHALAVRLLRHRYGDDVFERCRAPPEGWLRSHKSISLDSPIAGRLTPCRVHWVHPYRASKPATRELRGLYSVSLSEYAPLPASTSDTWHAGDVEPLFDELEGFARDLREHEDEVESLRTQTIGVLSSYGTVEMLSRDWPEGYALLPAEMLSPAASSVGAPAVRIADLNLRVEKIREAA